MSYGSIGERLPSHQASATPYCRTSCSSRYRKRPAGFSSHCRCPPNSLTDKQTHGSETQITVPPMTPLSSCCRFCPPASAAVDRPSLFSRLGCMMRNVKNASRPSSMDISLPPAHTHNGPQQLDAPICQNRDGKLGANQTAERGPTSPTYVMTSRLPTPRCLLEMQRQLALSGHRQNFAILKSTQSNQLELTPETER